MTRTRIKICGITRIEDALLAAELGADAIGLNFYHKSLRYLDINMAREIINCLPPFITTVGLFVNPEIEYVENIMQHLALDVLQFHGEETAEFCQRFGRPYIKAIAMKETTDLQKQIKNYAQAQALLLDNQQGGSGKTFAWHLIPKEIAKPIILAGGLTAENVVRAIKEIRPYAVDVTTGVEQEPRIKSREKMLNFFNAVKSI